jgi:hypothetical protein
VSLTALEMLSVLHLFFDLRACQLGKCQVTKSYQSKWEVGTASWISIIIVIIIAFRHHRDSHDSSKPGRPLRYKKE